MKPRIMFLDNSTVQCSTAAMGQIPRSTERILVLQESNNATIGRCHQLQNTTNYPARIDY